MKLRCQNDRFWWVLYAGKYEGVKAEHHTWKTIGVFDVSHMGETFC